MTAASYARTWRGKVFAFFQDAGPRGATDEELIDALKGNPSSVRPRRIELTQDGMLVDSGRTRRTRGGVTATVWVMRGYAEIPTQEELFR